MNGQRQPNSLSPLGSDFDSFLFAPIGEDNEGMLLSVISALARLDLDPWEEAATLVRLPQEVATRRLATLIATFPDTPSTHHDPDKIAERLIALLPRQVATVFPAGTVLATARSVVASASGIYMLLFAMFLVSIAGGQWLSAHSRLPATEEQVPTPACSTAILQSSRSPGLDQSLLAIR